MFRKFQQVIYIFVVILLSSCSPSVLSSDQTSYDTNTPPASGYQQSAQPTSVISTQPAGGQSLMHQPPANLSTGDLDSTIPQGILNEIIYMGGMGGTGEDCLFYNNQTPTILIDSMFENPVRTDSILIHVCGLSSKDENVDVKVELPDGTVRHYQETSVPTPNQNYYQVDYSSIVELNDPLGIYHFIFTGSGWSVDQYLTISDLTKPKLIIDPDANELTFVKFQPNEIVKLLVYSPITLPTYAKLVGWKDFQVDKNGMLIISLNSDLSSSDYGYIAIGDISGVVDLYDKGSLLPSWSYNAVK